MIQPFIDALIAALGLRIVETESLPTQMNCDDGFPQAWAPEVLARCIVRNGDHIAAYRIVAGLRIWLKTTHRKGEVKDEGHGLIVVNFPQERGGVTAISIKISANRRSATLTVYGLAPADRHSRSEEREAVAA